MSNLDKVFEFFEINKKLKNPNIYKDFFNNSDFIAIVENQYPMISVQFENRKEIQYLILNTMKEPPRCKSIECNNYVNFGKQKYRDYCSKSCASAIRWKDENTVLKKKQTSIEKYGCEFASQNEKVKEKAKKTNINKYGCEFPAQSDLVKEKMKKTNFERYGGVLPIHQDESKLKIRNTVYNRYGVDHICKSEIIQEKIQKTNMERYGSPSPFGSPMIQQKSKKTIREKYGVDYASCSPLIKEKIKNTNIKKYGTSCSLLYEPINRKSKKTIREKYGVDHIQHRNLSEYGLQVLNNPELFQSEILTHGVCKMATLANCNIGCIYTYSRKHNVDIPKYPMSQLEQDMAEFLNSNGIIFNVNNRSVISPYELDFYLPDYKIAIEMNGVYWHSDKFKNKDYHYNKWKMCNDLGIDLYSIFEDDWVNPISNTMWKNKILHLCGKVPHQKIYARNCIIKEVDGRLQNEFLMENHLQGKCNSKYKIGLFYNNELVSLMTFYNTRDNKNRTIDLNRFCSKIGFQIIGGAQKLLKYFIKKYGNDYDTIVSFSDNSYQDGRLYSTLGFSFEYDLAPDYKYVVDGFREHKANYRKDKIKSKFGLSDDYVLSKQERVLMEEQDIFRIYDCGKKKWVLHLR